MSEVTEAHEKGGVVSFQKAMKSMDYRLDWRAKSINKQRLRMLKNAFKIAGKALFDAGVKSEEMFIFGFDEVWDAWKGAKDDEEAQKAQAEEQRKKRAEEAKEAELAELRSVVASQQGSVYAQSVAPPSVAPSIDMMQMMQQMFQQMMAQQGTQAQRQGVQQATPAEDDDDIHQQQTQEDLTQGFTEQQQMEWDRLIPFSKNQLKEEASRLGVRLSSVEKGHAVDVVRRYIVTRRNYK